jgi:hypothetical protein
MIEKKGGKLSYSAENIHQKNGMLYGHYAQHVHFFWNLRNTYTDH